MQTRIVLGAERELGSGKLNCSALRHFSKVQHPEVPESFSIRSNNVQRLNHAHGTTGWLRFNLQMIEI